jgi:two-component system NarL family response regulator
VSAGTPPLRVVIADDHALFRQGLRSMLDLHEEVVVVGEVGSAGALPALLAETACDILLLDLQMERNSTADIPVLAERVPIVVVTASERLAEALAAVRAGARAVVFKRFAIETLMTAITAVASGGVWMPTELQAALASELRVPAARKLTAREHEIVRHVALGMRNAEVAKQLSITEVTVKTHLNNVFQKLGVRDRVELTLYAIRTGLIALHEGRR